MIVLRTHNYSKISKTSKLIIIPSSIGMAGLYGLSSRDKKVLEDHWDEKKEMYGDLGNTIGWRLSAYLDPWAYTGKRTDATNGLIWAASTNDSNDNNN